MAVFRMACSAEEPIGRFEKPSLLQIEIEIEIQIDSLKRYLSGVYDFDSDSDFDSDDPLTGFFKVP